MQTSQLVTEETSLLPQLPLAAHWQRRPKVVLHRDDYHEIASVVTILCQVVQPLQESEAQQIATTAFTEGKAVVIARPLEIAEYYQEQLQRFSLTVTLELP